MYHSLEQIAKPEMRQDYQIFFESPGHIDIKRGFVDDGITY
jgi:hypothetical protein